VSSWALLHTVLHYSIISCLFSFLRNNCDPRAINKKSSGRGCESTIITTLYQEISAHWQLGSEFSSDHYQLLLVRFSLSLYYVCTKRNPKVRKTKKKQKRAAKLVYQLHERKIFRKWRQNQSPKISNNQHWLVDDGWWHMNEEGNWAIRRQLTRVQQQIHTHKKTTRPIHYANTGHNKLVSCTTFTQPNKSH
jgi:hypothetical protein